MDFFAFLKDQVKNIGKARGGETVWHGTDFRNIPSIQDKGFTKSYSGWYGQGVYTSHDKLTASSFGRTLKGELPPGFKYKTVKANSANGVTDTNSFLRAIGIPEAAIQADHPVKDYNDFTFYNNSFDPAKRLSNYHGVRIEGIDEPQLLVFDNKMVNTIFDTDGPKAGPSTPLNRKPPTNRKALLMGLAGMKGYGGLSRTFAAGETGNQLAELVTLISEGFLGPLDPKKKTKSKKKTK